MRILTLIENHPDQAQPALTAEHGLSFYIENCGHVVMSDVGQSGEFAANAGNLGVDLSVVEALVISHHHYDHGGGLDRFFKENHHARVYLRQSPTEVFVADSPPDPLRDIGLDQGLLETHSERIEMISQNQAVTPGLHLLTDIPQTHPKPCGDQRLKAKHGSRLIPDSFEHELVTVLEDAQGLVVLTGCAHNGVLNMIAAVRQALPGKPIRTVVGGFHLHHETAETVQEIGKALLDSGIPAIYTGHCTGEAATDLLEAVLGARLHRLATGLVMTF